MAKSALNKKKKKLKKKVKKAFLCAFKKDL